MQLLVSVADACEARAALLGGADVIDAKDPRRGALGAVSQRALRAIRATVRSRRPVSAVLGDARGRATLERAARAASRLGVIYVKVGFRGVTSPARAGALAAAVRAAADGARVIVVTYADWTRAETLPPVALADVAARAGVAGVLLDTAFKDAGGLFDLLTPAEVKTWVDAAHAAGLSAALAGKLDGCGVATARLLGADIAGVRGAVCVGGRTGRVSRARVAALSALVAGTGVALASARV